MGECSRCHRVVALYEGRAVVRENVVVLFHQSCYHPGVERLQPAQAPETTTVSAEPTAPVAARPRPAGKVRAIAGIASLGAAGLIAALAWPSTAASSVPAVEPLPLEATATRVALTTREPAPPRAAWESTSRHAIPMLGGASIAETYPSLIGWTHPVAASSELMPPLNTRWFGAERAGVERRECGAGHCGVDLDAPRGRPVVAVAAALVLTVDRLEDGVDGRSGRYVRLQHDDGAITAYMHLDDVASGLRGGDRVMAGQYLGTLGASGIHSALPHLHFSLEVPRTTGQRGARIETRYVDPAPFLVRAKIVPVRERARRDAF